MRSPERPSRFPRAIWLGLALFVAACGDPGTGPIDLRFDRATCDRCRMVLSDRHHAAQVRIKTQDGRSLVHPFDDLGCALVWLEGQPGRGDPTTEIWVNDWRTGEWIDARKASFVSDQITPMEFGLGAQPDAAPGTLSFNEARAHVFEVERKNNFHGGHPGPVAPSVGERR